MTLFPNLTDNYYVDNDHNILKMMDYTYSKYITINQSFWSEADLIIWKRSGSMPCETKKTKKRPTELCSECISVMKIFLPPCSYSLYVWGTCSVCQRKIHVTNPEFYIQELPLTPPYASIVSTG